MREVRRGKYTGPFEGINVNSNGVFDGVLLIVNRTTMNILHRVEPYVTYRYPNPKSVGELIYKKGYGKLKSKERVFDRTIPFGK